MSYTNFFVPLPANPLPFNPLPCSPRSQFTQKILYFTTSHIDLIHVFSLIILIVVLFFGGIVICKLVFFPLCLKSIYEWVHMIIVFLVWVTSLNMMFSSFIHLSANFKMSLFFSFVYTPLYKCTIFFLSILCSRDINILSH